MNYHRIPVGYVYSPSHEYAPSPDRAAYPAYPVQSSLAHADELYPSSYPGSYFPYPTKMFPSFGPYAEFPQRAQIPQYSNESISISERPAHVHHQGFQEPDPTQMVPFHYQDSFSSSPTLSTYTAYSPPLDFNTYQQSPSAAPPVFPRSNDTALEQSHSVQPEPEAARRPMRATRRNLSLASVSTEMNSISDPSDEDKHSEEYFPAGENKRRYKSPLSDEAQTSPTDDTMKRTRGLSASQRYSPLTSRRNSKGSTNKGAKRQSRALAYNPSVRFVTNQAHEFYIITYRLCTDYSKLLLPVSLNIDSVRKGTQLYKALVTNSTNYTSTDFELNHTYIFENLNEGHRYRVVFLEHDIHVSLENGPHEGGFFPREYDFLHFEPGKNTKGEQTVNEVQEKVTGETDWWRLQVCEGIFHKLMIPESGGAWSARWDVKKHDRRPARILNHFATCKGCSSSRNPHGVLSRACLTVQTHKSTISNTESSRRR